MYPPVPTNIPRMCRPEATISVNGFKLPPGVVFASLFASILSWHRADTLLRPQYLCIIQRPTGQHATSTNPGSLLPNGGSPLRRRTRGPCSTMITETCSSRSVSGPVIASAKTWRIMKCASSWPRCCGTSTWSYARKAMTGRNRRAMCCGRNQACFAS
jgi:hypothetical protein